MSRQSPSRPRRKYRVSRFTITSNGTERNIYNTALTNILFLGIDTEDPIENTYAPGDAGQADCIMLLSLNDETQEATIIQINRNTMTALDVYDRSGNYLKTLDGQLCLQYAYSIGGTSSSWAMKKNGQLHPLRSGDRRIFHDGSVRDFRD